MSPFTSILCAVDFSTLAPRVSTSAAIMEEASCPTLLVPP